MVEPPKPPRAGRPLTRDERALWDRVTAKAKPMPEAPPPPGRPATLATPPGRSLRPLATLAEARSAPGLGRAAPVDALGRSTPGLDKRTAERLRKGRTEPQARIDLHGMTADRAHAALTRFVLDSRAQGLRCVLVITGRGGEKLFGRGAEDAPFMPRRQGVLRHSVPRWLQVSPLAGAVVGVYRAHASHGGDGALYVYLKRRR